MALGKEDIQHSQTQQEQRPISHEAIERLKKISEQIIQDRDGKLFEDSTEMIRQRREERTEYLEQLHEQK